MRTVVLLSGGMDSATLLYDVVASQGKDMVLALSANYGQRHRRELESAWRLALKVGVEHVLVDLAGVGKLLSGSALTDPSVPVPEGHYEHESMRATVVPMRNAIFLSVAVGLAWARGADTVMTAVHAGDHAIYPDCRPAFVDAFDAMVEQASAGMADIDVIAPYVRMTKAEIAALGVRLGVPWAETWSCYKGGERHCGRCGTCVERIEALLLARADDPTEYGDQARVSV